MPEATTAPACPQCGLENTYPDGINFVCPDCSLEWPMVEQADEAAAETDGVIRDVNGNVLADGDAVILIKDLKVKGSSIVLKKAQRSKAYVCLTVRVTTRWIAKPTKAASCSRPAFSRRLEHQIHLPSGNSIFTSSTSRLS